VRLCRCAPTAWAPPVEPAARCSVSRRRRTEAATRPSAWIARGMAHHHHPPPGGGGWRPPYGGPAPPSGGGPFGAHNAHPAPGAAPYGGPPPSFADIHRTPSYPEQPHASVDAIIPACPTTFPQIQNMSVEELRVHLGDPVAFDRLIREHPHCQCVHLP
jgi:hypothetical protein